MNIIKIITTALEKLSNKQNSLATDVTNEKYPTVTAVNTHVNNTTNPHNVTKAQIGLSNVDNTSDANKPISTATQTALNTKALKTIQVTPVTVTVASWSLVSGLYESTISNASITASKIVDVIPSNASISVVTNAVILPYTLSASGNVKIYATNLPTAYITVTLNIQE